MLIQNQEAQTLRGQIKEMPKEIDNLVEQRDEAMNISEKRLRETERQRERMFLWKEGYFFCLCVGGWTKRVGNTIWVCEYD